MGIVRLAKSLRILKVLEEYETRKTDHENKIDGNRIYMDFVSIVYRVSNNVKNELNYILFTLLLIDNNLADKFDFTKYNLLLDRYQNNISVLKNKNISSANFLDELTDDLINKLVYIDVIEFIYDMINNKIHNAEYLLISFDGIPSYGKIIEQRQRRYMRYANTLFIEKIKEKIIDNSKDSDSPIIKLRNKYDRLEINVDIGNAISYVYKSNKNKQLENDLRDKLNIDIKIIDRKYGEGEKILIDKLFEDYQKYNDTKSYVFYSPDGDSVILCLNSYLQTKAKNLTVIKTYVREPNQIEKTQYVRMDNMYNIIVELIESYIKIKYPSRTFTHKFKDGIVRDYLFIMNLYGNDFVHGTPTMDIGMTTIDMIYIYAKYIEMLKNDFILNMSDKKVFINYKSFKEFMKFMSIYEDKLMMDSYLGNVDRNSFLQKTFGYIFTMEQLIEYRKSIRHEKYELYQSLKNHKNLDTKSIMSSLNSMILNLESIQTISEIKFSDIFKKLELKNGKISLQDYAIKIKNDISFLKYPYPSYLYKINIRQNKRQDDIKEKILEIESQLIKNNIPINIEEIEDSNDWNIKSFAYEYKQIRKNISHEMMITNDIDIELYMLEWRLGKWKTLLNANSIELGYDSKINKPKKLYYEMKRYQYDVVGLSDTRLKKMVLNYIRTLSWITDYYLNSYNKTTENFISTWGYTYEFSPFITMISDYLESIDYKEMKHALSNIFNISLVPTKDYISSKQHKLYIYPHKPSELELLYQKIPDSYHKSFPDMNKYIDNTLNDDTNEKHFDCRLTTYFSKCIFESKHLNYKELKNLIC